MVEWVKLTVGVGLIAFSLYWLRYPRRVFNVQFRGSRWQGVENTDDVELNDFAVAKRRVLAVLLLGFSLIFAVSAVL